MNNYPVWWDTTVTLYNKYEDSKGEVTWYRTVLEGCFWKYTGEFTRTKDSGVGSTSAICRIRHNSDYVDRQEWEEQDDKSSFFTIGREDILVKGEVDDEIDEYQSGSRSSDLLNKYRNQGCIEITEYTINIGAGRVNEHYLVKGA